MRPPALVTEGTVRSRLRVAPASGCASCDRKREVPGAQNYLAHAMPGRRTAALLAIACGRGLRPLARQHSPFIAGHRRQLPALRTCPVENIDLFRAIRHVIELKFAITPTAPLLPLANARATYCLSVDAPVSKSISKATSAMTNPTARCRWPSSPGGHHAFCRQNQRRVLRDCETCDPCGWHHWMICPVAAPVR